MQNEMDKISTLIVHFLPIANMPIVLLHLIMKHMEMFLGNLFKKKNHRCRFYKNRN